MVYGYDTELSRDKIHNHAEQLVAALYANRSRCGALHRPIIFVAHSVGGLIVKRALIISSEISGPNTDHLRSISVSTYGILFLGTPHNGFDVAKWASRLGWVNSAHPQLEPLESFNVNSETLQNIERQFIQLVDQWHTFFFHEGKPMKLEGRLEYVVDEDSASPTIRDVERACIQQDHLHICKFEAFGSPGFDLVTEAIQRYVSGASETISRRWEFEQRQKIKKRNARAEELLPSRSHNDSSLEDHKEDHQRRLKGSSGVDEARSYMRCADAR